MTDDIFLEQLTPMATTVELPRYLNTYHGIIGTGGTVIFNLRQNNDICILRLLMRRPDYLDPEIALIAFAR